MRFRLLILPGLFILLLLFGLKQYYSYRADGLNALERRFSQKIQLQVGEVNIAAYLADAQSERALGLSGIATLSEKTGVLFVFPSASRYSFWMKDMLIPLDFVWIANGVIVDLTVNVQPESWQPPNSFTAATEFDSVIELPAGTIDKYRLTKGLTVSQL